MQWWTSEKWVLLLRKVLNWVCDSEFLIWIGWLFMSVVMCADFKVSGKHLFHQRISWVARWVSGLDHMMLMEISWWFLSQRFEQMTLIWGYCWTFFYSNFIVVCELPFDFHELIKSYAIPKKIGMRLKIVRSKTVRGCEALWLRLKRGFASRFFNDVYYDTQVDFSFLISQSKNSNLFAFSLDMVRPILNYWNNKHNIQLLLIWISKNSIETWQMHTHAFYFKFQYSMY